MNCERCPLYMKGCELVYINGVPHCPAQLDNATVRYSTNTDATE